MILIQSHCTQRAKQLERTIILQAMQGQYHGSQSHSCFRWNIKTIWNQGFPPWQLNKALSINFFFHFYRIQALSSSALVSSKTKRNSFIMIAALALLPDPHTSPSTIGNRLLTRRLTWPLHGIVTVSRFDLHAPNSGTIRNFEKVLLEGYRWLADKYEPGDKIFLFGKLHPFRTKHTDDGLVPKDFLGELIKPARWQE